MSKDSDIQITAACLPRQPAVTTFINYSYEKWIQTFCRSSLVVGWHLIPHDRFVHFYATKSPQPLGNSPCSWREGFDQWQMHGNMQLIKSKVCFSLVVITVSEKLSLYFIVNEISISVCFLSPASCWLDQLSTVALCSNGARDANFVSPLWPAHPRCFSVCISSSVFMGDSLA